MGRNSPAPAGALALTAALLWAFSVGPAAAAPTATSTPCRNGLVALTFDDGPVRSITPGLVRTLVEHQVPATFFMVGSRVEAAPDVARLVQRSGFTVANHTWSHHQLTHLSGDAVKKQVRTTSDVLRKHHLTPSRLMRPPYGDIDDRVRHLVEAQGLHPVLWSIDSLDWSGGDKRQIAHRVLAALRPHRTNLVLQHDGVDNSPASVAAVPIIIRGAWNKGYCFTHLTPTGEVAAQRSRPVPVRTTARAASAASSGSAGAAGHPGTGRVVPKVAGRPAVETTLVRVSAPSKAGSRVLFASAEGAVRPCAAYLAALAAAAER